MFGVAVNVICALPSCEVALVSGNRTGRRTGRFAGRPDQVRRIGVFAAAGRRPP